MTPLSDQGMAPPTRPTSPASRLGPAEALADLLAGNRRFVAGWPRYGHDFRAAAAASGDQQPYALVLGCIDSRVPLEAIFDQNFGAICVARSGAHVLDRALLGSVEFAVQQLAVPLVMVLGHERCGAVASTVEAMRSGRRPTGALAYLVEEIAPAVAEAGGPHHPQVHSRALRRHVNRTVQRLRELDDVSVVGAVYDLDSGRVDVT
jgi:carbonic anhydrase